VQYFWGTVVREGLAGDKADELTPERPGDRAGLLAFYEDASGRLGRGGAGGQRGVTGAHLAAVDLQPGPRQMPARHAIEKLVERCAGVGDGAGVDADDPLGTEAGSTGVGQVPSSTGAGSASAGTAGLGSIREWLMRYPLSVRWKHRPAWSNGQLAVGCYIFDRDKGSFPPAVIDVLTLAGEKISAVTAFQAADMTGLPPGAGQETGAQFFARFGLPAGLT
jgi:hypothetical protein